MRHTLGLVLRYRKVIGRSSLAAASPCSNGYAYSSPSPLAESGRCARPRTEDGSVVAAFSLASALLSCGPLGVRQPILILQDLWHLIHNERSMRLSPLPPDCTLKP